MAETEKPRRKPGMSCPLWQKDVSKVCHTCELYQPLAVGEMVENKFTNLRDVWGCAYVHALQIQKDNLTPLNGNQVATESLRNEVAELIETVRPVVEMIEQAAQQRTQLK